PKQTKKTVSCLFCSLLLVNDYLLSKFDQPYGEPPVPGLICIIFRASSKKQAHHLNEQGTVN
ncbi:hypothetical protein ACPV3O_23940, partial [Vibrio rotiferianus]|uniref:hypothetical protein n=1 Tax=Vibrio rotiferianus TaxID=190895 RepID=UPI00406AA0DB